MMTEETSDCKGELMNTTPYPTKKETDTEGVSDLPKITQLTWGHLPRSSPELFPLLWFSSLPVSL